MMKNEQVKHVEYHATYEQSIELLQRSQQILHDNFEQMPTRKEVLYFAQTIAVLDTKASIDKLIMMDLPECIHESLSQLVFTCNEIDTVYEE